MKKTIQVLHTHVGKVIPTTASHLPVKVTLSWVFMGLTLISALTEKH